MNGSSRLVNVLWITNIVSPYRIPVWQSLAKRVNLKMALLARSEPNRAWDFTEEQVGVSTNFLGAPVFRSGEHYLYWPSRKLRHLLMQDCDAVILGGWEGPAYFYALWMAKKRGMITISHSGSTNRSHSYSSGLVSMVRSWFFRQLDAHVTYGTEATESLLSKGVQAERVVTGFNSVDHAYYHDGVNVIRSKNIDQWQTGHVFLYVGQLLKRKNVDSVIRAFSLIKNDSDSLRIVGSGPEQEFLQNLIAELGLVNEVDMVGPKSGEALLEEYARSNTLVLASSNEVWGLVVNEALAGGLHVVVSENCGATADVYWMKGVYPCAISPDQIAKALRKSADEWQGPITGPSILKFSLVQSADNFFAAIQLAKSQH